MSLSDRSCVVVILTFNSGGVIAETVAQALKVSRNIFLVDSGSTDDTLEIAKRMGCTVSHRPFLNYSDQRNWAISQVSEGYEWQLHLDADEVLDDAAIDSITSVLAAPGGPDAYMLRRRDYFMGRRLRFSGVNPWHLRLFRTGAARCENRLYDQHFVAECRVHKLKGLMHDKNALALSDWIARHNRWSDLEVTQVARETSIEPGILRPNLFGDSRERTRYIKGLYYRLPTGSRALSYFIYRYFFCLGILDGIPGFYFAFFQALWFRMLVDAKLYEHNVNG